MTWQDRLNAVETYQKSINSKRTFLYEARRSETSTTFTVILADTDEEAIHIAKIIAPDCKVIQMDHWGRGPVLEIK